MTTQTQLVAKLLELERGDAADDRAAAARVFDKMFAELVPIIGDRGVVAVFVRSAASVKARCPALAPLAVAPDSVGAVSANIRDHFASVGAEDVTACALALTAAFVALMSRLIGFPLTLQLLQRAWPEIDSKEPR